MTMSPIVMGILNVTPDSFSEPEALVEGARVSLDAAIARGMTMVADGAAIIDVGGESTRPGAQDVPVEEEQRRVLPVIEALAARGLTVSVDTRRADTAKRAIAAGASIVNDVSCAADPDMLPMIASTGARYVLMHNRGTSADMYALAQYSDISREVAAELAAALKHAQAAGVQREQIIVDPGLGFAKTPEQNWQLLRGISSIEALGLPVLLGASRKRFLGELLAADGELRAVDGRDTATAALSMWAATRRMWGVRVHDVRSTCDTLAVAQALEAADEH